MLKKCPGACQIVYIVVMANSDFCVQSDKRIHSKCI